MNSHIKILIFAFILLVFPFNTRADEQSDPYPYVTTSLFGDYYFKMIPIPEEDGYDHRKMNGFGICFRVLPLREDEVLWKTTGWYAFRIYLSGDGKFLIRMGDWPIGHELSDAHMALALPFIKRVK